MQSNTTAPEIDVIATELEQIKNTLCCLDEFLDEGYIPDNVGLDEAKHRALSFCNRLRYHKSILYTAHISLTVKIKELQILVDKMMKRE